TPPHLPSFPTRRSSDLVEDFRKRLLVEVVFELTRAVLRVRRRIRFDPRLAVELLPLALEAARPTSADPVLGFFQVYRFGARVQRDRKSTRLNSSHVAIS